MTMQIKPDWQWGDGFNVMCLFPPGVDPSGFGWRVDLVQDGVWVYPPVQGRGTKFPTQEAAHAHIIEQGWDSPFLEGDE